MSRFLSALSAKNVGRPPIWVMRQAGRYLPEYRALRQKYSFLTLAHTPELAAEITLQPIRRFGMDAAILFSDILVIAEAFGVGLAIEEGVGPLIERPLHSSVDVARLQVPAVEEALSYVRSAIDILGKELSVPLLGFCGAPFTVASYMIEGKSSRDLKKTKQWMLRDPASFHALLEKIAEASIAYLNMQAAGGVACVQIFDSWANSLAPAQFREFSLKYLQKMVERVTCPVLLFCRGSPLFVEELAKTGARGIALDWSGDVAVARKRVAHTVLQGNLDPMVLYAPKQTIQKETRCLLESMRHDTAYIFNLGHGVLPDTPLESMETLVDTVQSFS